MKTRRWMMTLGAVGVALGFAACEPEESTNTSPEERETCAQGEGSVFTEQGEELCVIPQKIIEVGFDCPLNFVGLQTYGQLAICGGGTSIDPGEFEFSFSDVFRDDLVVAYPDFVPRGACSSTLCGGLALCVSDGSCEMVTSVNQASFMCTDGVCTLEDLPSGPQPFACDASCTSDCMDTAQWTCAEDGARYCSACTTECYGQQVATDQGSCGEPPTSRVEACVRDCGESCGDQANQWFCASDAKFYCTSCEVHCLGHAVAPPELCQGALPPRGQGDPM